MLLPTKQVFFILAVCLLLVIVPDLVTLYKSATLKPPQVRGPESTVFPFYNCPPKPCLSVSDVGQRLRK